MKLARYSNRLARVKISSKVLQSSGHALFYRQRARLETNKRKELSNVSGLMASPHGHNLRGTINLYGT